MAPAPNQHFLLILPASRPLETDFTWPRRRAVFSKRLVGRPMKAEMTLHHTTDAPITTTCVEGKPDSLLHPSYQGSQYTGEQLQRLMTDHGITCSASQPATRSHRPGELFSSFRVKRTISKIYRTNNDAK